VRRIWKIVWPWLVVTAFILGFIALTATATRGGSK
jgi:hypothetical protein